MFMFQRFKRMLGFSRAQTPKASSHGPKTKSKAATQLDDKLPLSIDSKKKAQEQLLLTKQMDLRINMESMDEMDDVITTRKHRKMELINDDCVSAIDPDDEQNLLSDILFNTPRKSQNSFQNENKQQRYSEIILRRVEQHQSLKDCKIQLKIPQEPQPQIKSRLTRRAPSPRKVRKILARCPFCDQTLTMEDSCKMSCVHRFHQKCAVKMKERNRYQCDLCEVKKGNKGSILLMNNHRSRPSLQYSRPLW